MTLSATYLTDCESVHWDMIEHELVTKLQSIASQLETIGQYEEKNVVELYTPLCLHLANENFTNHHNKAVQLWTAICLAEVLRIYAPNEPYSSQQMKGILTLFISLYEGLKNPNGANFQTYVKLLQNLALVKTFNTCFGLADEENILCSLFQITFLVLNDENAKYLHSPMLEILSAIVSDNDAILCTDVLMIILLNIMEPIKSTKISNYELAKELFARCHAPLAPFIRSFLKNILHERDDRMVLLDHNKTYKVFDVVTELMNISTSSMLNDILLQLTDAFKDSTEILCDIPRLYSTDSTPTEHTQIPQVCNKSVNKEIDFINKFGLKEAKVVLVRLEYLKELCPQMPFATFVPVAAEKDPRSVETVPTNAEIVKSSPNKNSRKRPHQPKQETPTIEFTDYTDKSYCIPPADPASGLNDCKLRRLKLSTEFEALKRELPHLRKTKKWSKIGVMEEATICIRELRNLEQQLVIEHTSLQGRNDVLRSRLAQLDPSSQPEMICID